MHFVSSSNGLMARINPFRPRSESEQLAREVDALEREVSSHDSVDEIGLPFPPIMPAPSAEDRADQVNWTLDLACWYGSCRDSALRVDAPSSEHRRDGLAQGDGNGPVEKPCLAIWRGSPHLLSLRPPDLAGLPELHCTPWCDTQEGPEHPVLSCCPCLCSFTSAH